MGVGYLGELKIFGGSFAPRNWALCHGQLLPVSENQALFSLLGTVYGGDGRSTFGLPDLRGRIPVHSGGSIGPGMPSIALGQKGGHEWHTLTVNEIATHTHPLNVADTDADSGSPYMAATANLATNQKLYKQYDPSSVGYLDGEAMTMTGGGLKHYNVMPSYGVNFIICITGDYPTRN